MAGICDKLFLFTDTFFHRSKYHSGKNHYKYKNGCKTKNGYRDRRHKYCSEIRDLPAAVQKDIFLSFFSLCYSVTVNPLKSDCFVTGLNILRICFCCFLIYSRNPVQITVCYLSIFVHSHHEISGFKWSFCRKTTLVVFISLRFLRRSLCRFFIP